METVQGKGDVISRGKGAHSWDFRACNRKKASLVLVGGVGGGGPTFPWGEFFSRGGKEFMLEFKERKKNQSDFGDVAGIKRRMAGGEKKRISFMVIAKIQVHRHWGKKHVILKEKGSRASPPGTEEPNYLVGKKLRSFWYEWIPHKNTPYKGRRDLIS